MHSCIRFVVACLLVAIGAATVFWPGRLLIVVAITSCLDVATALGFAVWVMARHPALSAPRDRETPGRRR